MPRGQGWRLVWALLRIRRRYRNVYRALLPADPLPPLRLVQRQPPIANHCVVYGSSLLNPLLQAVRYACTIADSVDVVMVMEDPADEPQLRQRWRELVGEHLPQRLQLVLLESPYSSLIEPFCDYVISLEGVHRERTTTVVMPMVIPRDRLDRLLLNQRVMSLYRMLSQDHSRVFSIVRTFIG